MGKRLGTAIDNRRRIRRSVEYLESHLRQRPDAWPTLSELAEAAALSPFHFIRLYQNATGETPVATARRLKLQGARTRLAMEPRASVLDVALSCGYENAQAFARAFRREFGSAPTRRAQHAFDESVPGATSWVTNLPPLPMQALAIGANGTEAALTFDELMGFLDVAAVPRYQQDMFCVISPDLHLVQACVLDSPGIPRMGLDSRRHGDGLHLCISGQPQAVWRRWRDPLVAAAKAPDGPMLLRYLNDPAYRVLAEQRIELYVPLRSASSVADLEHAFLRK
ncbi:MAG TPA: AraC family transcriptional regulator [Ramlibacter sp.]|nr:AraC family transcriptional regulator [Ramlibacter sp.]